MEGGRSGSCAAPPAKPGAGRDWQVFAAFLPKFKNMNGLADLAAEAEAAGQSLLVSYKYSGSLVMVGPDGYAFSKNAANNDFSTVGRRLLELVVEAGGQRPEDLFAELRRERLTLCMEVVCPHLLGDHGAIPQSPAGRPTAFFVVTLVTRVGASNPCASTPLPLGELVDFCERWALPLTEYWVVAPAAASPLASQMEAIRFHAHCSDFDRLLAEHCSTSPVLFHRDLQGEILEGFVVHRLDGDVAQLNASRESYRRTMSRRKERLQAIFEAQGAELAGLARRRDEAAWRNPGGDRAEKEPLPAPPGLEPLDDAVDLWPELIHPSAGGAAVSPSPSPSPMTAAMAALRRAYGHWVTLHGYRTAAGELLAQVSVGSDDVFYSWPLHSDEVSLLRGLVLVRADAETPHAAARSAGSRGSGGAPSCGVRIVQSAKLKCGRYIARTYLCRNLIEHLLRHGEETYLGAVSNRLKQWHWPQNAEDISWVTEMTSAWASFALRLTGRDAWMIQNDRYLRVLEPWLKEAQDSGGARKGESSGGIAHALVLVDLSAEGGLQGGAVERYLLGLPEPLPQGTGKKRKRPQPQLGTALPFRDQLPRLSHLPQQAGSAVMAVFHDEHNEKAAENGETDPIQKRRKSMLAAVRRQFQTSCAVYLENPSIDDWQSAVGAAAKPLERGAVCIIATAGVVPGGGKTRLAQTITENSGGTASKVVSSDHLPGKQFAREVLATIDSVEDGAFIVHDKNIPDIEGLAKLAKLCKSASRGVRLAVLFPPTSPSDKFVEGALDRIKQRESNPSGLNPGMPGGTVKMLQVFNDFVRRNRHGRKQLDQLASQDLGVLIPADFFCDDSITDRGDFEARLQACVQNLLQTNIEDLPRPEQVLTAIGAVVTTTGKKVPGGNSGYFGAFLDHIELQDASSVLHCTVVPPFDTMDEGEQLRALAHWRERTKGGKAQTVIRTCEYVSAECESNGRTRKAGVWMVRAVEGVTDAEFFGGQAAYKHVTDIASLQGGSSAWDGLRIAKRARGEDPGAGEAVWTITSREVCERSFPAVLRWSQDR